VSRNNDIDLTLSMVYMAFSLLCYSQNGLVPELLYFWFSKQIAEFIKVFGGETPRIPTRDEGLLAALAARLTMVERQS
jgi:hypothetical protein